MFIHTGNIHSLGNYTEITTQVVHEDGYGNRRSGMFDTQKERFIDGLQIGTRTFGRLSCPINLYGELEQGKEAVLYTWAHPFLGFPPLRIGLVGVAYPEEGRAYVMGTGQVVLSLVALALLPLLWFIPAFVLGGIAGSILPWLLSVLVFVLVCFAPWFAGLLMVVSYLRMKARFPNATTPPWR